MRIIACLLLMVMLLLATGAPQRMHQQSHANAGAGRCESSKSEQPLPAPSHDTCVMCMQFHSPAMADAGHAWLIDTGEWVRFVSMLPREQACGGFEGSISCRGPPGAA